MDILPSKCPPSVPHPVADGHQPVAVQAQPVLDQTKVDAPEEDDVLTQRKFFEIMENFKKDLFKPP